MVDEKEVARQFVMRAAIAAVLVTVAGAIVGSGVLWFRIHSALGHRYEVASEQPLDTAHADIERGRHLAEAVGRCTDCHGANLAGRPVAAPGLAIWAPNLTRGRGGTGSLSDAEFERAVRHGVRPDGTPLLAMPSWSYAKLSDADTAALLAYVRSVPPVDAVAPGLKLQPLGFALITSNQAVIDAARIDAEKPIPVDAPAGPPSAQAGAYLARAAGCMSCHGGASLRGSMVPGDPGAPLAPDLTAVAADETEDGFVSTLRTGRTPRLYVMRAPMPSYPKMTDDELRSIYLYVLSVTPKKPA